MSGTAGERLAELLGGLAELAASSAYCKLFMTDLSVAVDGVGPLSFPVSGAQAAGLRELGHRARFGRGEQTLTDPRVRDTWEIPKDLVQIEWTGRFEAALELFRDELGLPPHCELTPQLHSMLLYEPGQFFVTHQDSEKDDTMVGTLVVTLPSEHTGGELIIEEQGETVEYRGSAVAVSLVAFYSDRHHQVLPVKTGNRITLTYNLLLKGHTGTSAETAMAGKLAACLREHFTTPITLRYSHRKADPPVRLAYLLDHQYTARGLNWSRLKGSDADRAALLRAAADKAGCDVALALADIQETWDALDPDDADPWNDHGYYDDDGDDDFEDGDDFDDEDLGDEDDEESSPDDEQYVLQDLIDSTITLSHWIGPGADQPEEITLSIDDTEVAATTASAELKPYASEYEGYMGNYGNTLDRWYRRAALVIWPRDRAFANRAQASSTWALDEIDELARTGNIADARDAARTLAALWNAADGHRSRPEGELLGRALRTARELDDADTAAALLRPFQLEQIAPDHAPALADLAGLAARHGDTWTADLLRGWAGSWRTETYAHSPDLLEWLPGLPNLCTTLQAEGAAGTMAARHILDLAWKWFTGRVRPMLTGRSTVSRDTWLGDLGRPLAGILTAAAQTGSTAVLDDAVTLVRTQDNQVITLIMATLRAAKTLPTGGGHGEHGLDDLAACCAERLRAALARPQRTPGDWSIEPPAGCTCDQCRTLAGFLRDPGRRTHEWPLAKPGRAHIHSRIDGAELPVSHQTRRQGRPYTLVLAKTEALFERERTARRRHEADLAWLTDNQKPVP